MRNEVGFSVASEELTKEMTSRFEFITNPGNGEPIYVVATALDPRYRALLDAQQMAVAKNEILKLVKSKINYLIFKLRN